VDRGLSSTLLVVLSAHKAGMFQMNVYISRYLVGRHDLQLIEARNQVCEEFFTRFDSHT